jgi:hypothetical protein
MFAPNLPTMAFQPTTLVFTVLAVAGYIMLVLVAFM